MPHCHCHTNMPPPPTTMFIHPALLPGSSGFFFSSSSSDSDDDGAGTYPLQVLVEVPPASTSDGAAPLLEPTPRPRSDAGSSPAAVAFVLLFSAVVVAGLVFYGCFF